MARSCRVSSAPRSAAPVMAFSSSLTSGSCDRAEARLALVRMTVSRLAKSCAMPPASRPRLSSFWARYRRPSISCFSRSAAPRSSANRIARRGHRDLAAHRDQVLDLREARDADAFVAEGAAAEGAEGLVEQAQGDADDRAVAQLRDDAPCWCGGRCGRPRRRRAFGGEDLLHHRVAVDRDPRRHVPDEILAGAAVAEDADERRLLLVGDAQPGVIEAEGVPHLGAGHLEHVHEARGAPQLPREREQPPADGKQGAVHVNPCVERLSRRRDGDTIHGGQTTSTSGLPPTAD